MEKDAYYFKHDSNARFDNKIIKLRTKFGLEGYGFYFCMIEIMRDNANYMFCYDDVDILPTQLQIELSKAKAMLDFCLQVGLFLTDNENNVYSESFLQRMQDMNELRAKRQAAGAKGGKAKAMLKQNCSIKEKHIKENKIKENKITPDDIITNKIIETYKKHFNKNYRLSFNEKIEICNITNQEQYTLDDWELIFKNASKGWMIKNENVKPSLTNILENYSKFLNDDYNLNNEDDDYISKLFKGESNE